MQNLLLTRLSRREIAGLLGGCPVRSPLPAWGEEPWRRALAHPAAARIRERALRKAGDEISRDLPKLTDELYADFTATGVRVRFEDVYFKRRRMLARAAVAVLANPGSSAPLGSFLAKLEDVADELSWAFPAHVASPDGKDRRWVDLFAAETAVVLAEYLHVFAAVIPDVLGLRIRARLKADIFENYRDNHRHRPFWWTTIPTNWNAVCHQGVIGAALAIETDLELVADLLLIASRSLPYFFDGYGEDGACPEGTTYWEYGFGWLALLNEQLEARTGGALSLFHDDPRIERIAAYGPAVSLRNGHLVKFADCLPGVMLRVSTLAYLGRRTGDTPCALQAAENLALLEREPDARDASEERGGDWLHLSRLLLAAPGVPADEGTDRKPDAFFPSLGVWVARGRDRSGNDWELAAKGGTNGEHHNHNDIGSFVLNVNGVPLIEEIGAPVYSREFFGPERYAFLAARSLGHSVPVLNGHEQVGDGRFHAKVDKAEGDCPDPVFELDLASAYPPAAGCRRFLRRLTLRKEAGIVVWEDEIELAAPGRIESALITEADDVAIESSRTALIRKGQALRLSVEGGRWDRIEPHRYAARQGGTGTVRRFVLTPESQGASAFLRVTFTKI